MIKALGKSPAGLFATRTIGGHLVRGAVAFGLLAFAIGQQHAHGALSLGAGLLALVVMRGCPMCWAIGLVETVQQRWSAGQHRV
ncbi:hypothetical protein HLB44_27140 [Aquincola sp. S2]|uniref:DUF2892 domain-containing protein n=1 Tax=Pseudaquabacterium terrae TaxID=2732868 RepID=A0ABX2EPW5_9BURK|nr:hypothetical protein [Aquabacterium terrae]NRF70686.1 hypothetical protein [Aquabacterium terrae]